MICAGLKTWIGGAECKWWYRKGNERDSDAEEELESCIREKGEEGPPMHSVCLMDHELEEALNFPLNGKKTWFNSIEAVRGRVPMICNGEKDMKEDMRFTDYELQRESVRKWIALGWK